MSDKRPTAIRDIDSLRDIDSFKGLPHLHKGTPRKRRYKLTQAEFDKEHVRLSLKRESINALSAELSKQWADLITDTEIEERL